MSGIFRVLITILTCSSVPCLCCANISSFDNSSAFSQASAIICLMINFRLRAIAEINPVTTATTQKTQKNYKNKSSHLLPSCYVGDRKKQ